SDGVVAFPATSPRCAIGYTPRSHNRSTIGTSVALPKRTSEPSLQKEVSHEKNRHRRGGEPVRGGSGGSLVSRHGDHERWHASPGHGDRLCRADHYVPARRRRLSSVPHEPGRGGGISL